MLIEIILGFSLALILAFLGTRLFPERHLRIWSSGLIIAAVIYVGFALWGENYDWLPTELLGVLLYAVPAILSLYYSKYWLALGWALHVLWDLLLHPAGHPGFVPGWYPGVCLGFDLAIAGLVAYWVTTSKLENQGLTAK